jgi:hypothetical protein
MYLVGRKNQTALIYFSVTAALSVVLNFTWYKPQKNFRKNLAKKNA